MPLTPISTSHVLVFRYAQRGLTHSSRYYVNATPSSDPSGFDLLEVGVGVRALADVITDWKTVFGPVCGDTTTGAGWSLYEVGIGELILVSSGSYSFASVGGGHEVAGQAFLTYRDTANKLFKLEVLEGNYETPARSTSTADIGVAFGNLANSVLDLTAGGIGNWARSRGNHEFRRYIAYTATLNRKLRKRRGMV